MGKKPPSICPSELMDLYRDACGGQMKPNGNNCAVCGDIDHQAFECRFNPFVMFREALRELGLDFYYPKP